MPYNQSVQSRLPVCLDHTAHFYDICPLPSLVASLQHLCWMTGRARAMLVRTTAEKGRMERFGEGSRS